MAVLSVVAAAFLSLAQPGVARGAGAGSAPLEYQVKAAFILNFINFTEWPASALGAPSAPFRICVLGRDPFGEALDRTMEGETVHGHPVAVDRVSREDAARRCQILFVSASPESASLVKSLLDAPILMIGDSPGFLREGGVVAFALDQGRVRFDVARQNAERRGLVLSSRLLRVARRVE